MLGPTRGCRGSSEVLERFRWPTSIAVGATPGVACCAPYLKPEEMMKTGHFREDLYYRLSEMIIDIPPLRQQIGESALLAHHFLNLMDQESSGNIKGFTADAMRACGIQNARQCASSRTA